LNVSNLLRGVVDVKNRSVVPTITFKKFLKVIKKSINPLRKIRIFLLISIMEKQKEKSCSYKIIKDF
jgi:hypothetical protein